MKSFFLFNCVLTFLLVSAALPISNIKSSEFIQFIFEKQKETSYCIIESGDIVLDFNSSEKLGFANFSKLIVATEYAYQLAEGHLDSEEKIESQSIQSFIYPQKIEANTLKWMNKLGIEKKVNNIKLHDLVKGMLQFNSDELEEMVISKLGLDKVNNRIQELGFENQDKIVPPVSAWLISQEQNFEKSLSQNEKQYLIKKINQVHEKLSKGKSHKLVTKSIKAKNTPIDFSGQSSSLNFATFIDNLLNEEVIPFEVQEILAPLIFNWKTDENGYSDLHTNGFVAIDQNDSSLGILLYSLINNKTITSCFFFEELNQENIDFIHNEMSNLITDFSNSENAQSFINRLKHFQSH